MSRALRDIRARRTASGRGTAGHDARPAARPSLAPRPHRRSCRPCPGTKRGPSRPTRFGCCRWCRSLQGSSASVSTTTSTSPRAEVPDDRPSAGAEDRPESHAALSRQPGVQPTCTGCVAGSGRSWPNAPGPIHGSRSGTAAAMPTRFAPSRTTKSASRWPHPPGSSPRPSTAAVSTPGEKFPHLRAFGVVPQRDRPVMAVRRDLNVTTFAELRDRAHECYRRDRDRRIAVAAAERAA